MTAIHPTANLAAIIRRQVGTLARPTPKSSSGQARGSGKRPAAADEHSDVASLVARRVQALDAADPDRHHKAFRIFLESVLLAELGHHLINDVGFHQLVADVQGEMLGDADLAQAIRSATLEMLSSTTTTKATAPARPAP